MRDAVFTGSSVSEPQAQTSTLGTRGRAMGPILDRQTGPSGEVLKPHSGQISSSVGTSTTMPTKSRPSGRGAAASPWCGFCSRAAPNPPSRDERVLSLPCHGGPDQRPGSARGERSVTRAGGRGGCGRYPVRGSQRPCGARTRAPPHGTIGLVEAHRLAASPRTSSTAGEGAHCCGRPNTASGRT